MANLDLRTFKPPSVLLPCDFVLTLVSTFVELCSFFCADGRGCKIRINTERLGPRSSTMRVDVSGYLRLMVKAPICF